MSTIGRLRKSEPFQVDARMSGLMARCEMAMAAIVTESPMHVDWMVQAFGVSRDA